MQPTGNVPDKGSIPEFVKNQTDLMNIYIKIIYIPISICIILASYSFESKFCKYLLSHWFRVGDSRAEEAVPLQPAVQPGPVIVAVPSVGQTPGDQGVKLPVCRVAGLSYNKT